MWKNKFIECKFESDKNFEITPIQKEISWLHCKPQIEYAKQALGDSYEVKMKTEESILTSHLNLDQNRSHTEIMQPPLSSLSRKIKWPKQSEIFFSIILQKSTIFTKIGLLFKGFFFSQIIALSLNLLLMGSQTLYEDSCLLYSQTQKDIPNFSILLYAVMMSIIFIRMFHAYVMSLSIFFYKIMRKKYLLFVSKSFYFLFIFGFLCYFYFAFPKNTDFIYYEYSSAILILLFCYFIYLIIVGWNFRLCISHFFKGGAFLIMILILNFFICFLFAGSLFELMKNLFGAGLSENLIKIVLLVYTTFLRIFLEKLLFYYYEALIREEIDQNEINMKIIIMNRFVFSFIVVLNVVTISRMQLDDWGNWILIGNYLLCVIYSYTRIDILEQILKKILFFLFKIKKTKKTSSNFVKFEKILSGNLIDCNFICCARLLIMYTWHRWCSESTSFQFYKGCTFEISDKFPLNLWPILIIILLNVCILAMVFVYMKKSKKMIMSYKIVNNKFIDVYILFALHINFEGNLQMFANILFD